MKEKNRAKQQTGFFEKKWPAIGLIILASFLVYANSLKNEFVYDDEYLIVNSKYKSIEQIPAVLTSPYFVGSPEKSGIRFYRPIPIISFLIDYSVWGLNPFGYRFINILLHALNGILVYFLINLFLKNSKIALFTSLIFIVHPVQTEVVAYISARPDLLCAFFFLSSFVLFIKGTYPKLKLIYYSIAIIFYLVALMSKEMAVTLPLVLVIYDYYFISGRNLKVIMKKAKYYLPLLAAACLYILVRYSILGEVSRGKYWGGGLYFTLLTISRVFLYYIKLLFLPGRLCVEYAFPISKSFFEPGVLIAVACLIILVVIAVKSDKEYSFAVFWFFVTLIPVSNLIPISALIAERFLYLPSIGFCILLSIAALKIRVFSRAKNAVNFLFFCIFIFYAVRTIKRNTDWKNNLTLWTKTVESSPQSARAHYNLAVEYDKNKQYGKSISEYGKVIEISQDYTSAHNNLGLIYCEMGRYDEAISEFKRAIELDPKDVTLYNNLGGAYAAKKLYNKAVLEFKRAIEINSDYSDAHFNLAMVYKITGMYKKAIEEFIRVLEITPDDQLSEKYKKECSLILQNNIREAKE